MLLLQSEYSSSQRAVGEWESFVQHNWLPILSLALGPEWRTKYDSEVAAMIALQLSVQPLPTGDEAAPPAAATEADAPPTTATAPPLH